MRFDVWPPPSAATSGSVTPARSTMAASETADTQPMSTAAIRREDASSGPAVSNHRAPLRPCLAQRAHVPRDEPERDRQRGEHPREVRRPARPWREEHEREEQRRDHRSGEAGVRASSRPPRPR